MSTGLKSTGCIALIIIAVLLLGSGTFYVAKWGIPLYDELVALEESVQREWAQVDTQLQRRYDLIPNLVETVKGYAQHEQSLLTEIADAHTGYMKARSIDEKIEASYRTEGLMRRIFVWGKLYPDLRADQHFLSLMQSLERTEDKIAAQRMSYNEAVAELNSKVKSVAGRIVSKIAQVETASYYNPPEKTELPPTVDFSSDAGGAQTGGSADGGGSGTYDLSDLVIKGIMGSTAAPGGIKAIVETPDGESLTLVPGQELPQVKASVVEITPEGVTFEETKIDREGASLKRRVTISP